MAIPSPSSTSAPAVASRGSEILEGALRSQRDHAARLENAGPKLAGKLHLYVGEADTFYLDRAVHLLKISWETTTDPYYHGAFEFGVRKPHCYAGEYDSSVD